MWEGNRLDKVVSYENISVAITSSLTLLDCVEIITVGRSLCPLNHESFTSYWSVMMKVPKEAINVGGFSGLRDY